MLVRHPHVYESCTTRHKQRLNNVGYEIAGNILLIPLLDIYVDPEFNCRGYFSTQDVYTLGQDIRERGQLVPLIIQPIEDVLDEERPEPCAWTFRLVAGHRRYMAIDRFTEETFAECYVRTGLTKQQAHILNYTENLHRDDFNILQEAQGLADSWPNETIKVVSASIKKPKRWVKVRRDLLILPDYVQKKAAAGQLDQYDIETLSALPTDQIEPTFQNIITTKGKKKRTTITRGRQNNRSRGKKEIESMIALLFASDHFSGLTTYQRDLATSTLAWVLRGIDSREFLEKRLGFPEDCVIIDDSDTVEGLRK